MVQRGTTLRAVNFSPPRSHFGLVCAFLATAFASTLRAEPPSTAYIFPAGGQRGTTVHVRVGGHYLHDKCRFEMLGAGIEAPAEIARTTTTWFEGPLIRLPASQAAEDYPKDYAAELRIAADTPLGDRAWRVWNAQGAAASRRFVVGDLPEVVEQEFDGQPVPTAVTLPVTANGRIFPREDVDVWSFAATKGQSVTCAVDAAGIGSPLQACLEVRDSQGLRVADAVFGPHDPVLRFTPNTDGRFEVRIHDVRYAGLQSFVYRLTITDAEASHVLFAERSTTTLPELLETEPNDDAATVPIAALPAVFSGRIDQPGDMDAWTFAATKGSAWVLEVMASRLGSPLDSVIVVRDADGKELARGDDVGANVDAFATFTAPADGQYTVVVSERFASRGGPAFAYRLRIAAPQPNVRLQLATDAISVDRGKEQKLAVSILREQGFAAPVQLAVEGLPAGVTVAEVTVAANQNKGELKFIADPAASIAAARLCIVGRTELAGQPITVTANLPGRLGHADVDSVLLAVSLPTPFKFQGEFSLAQQPCGAVARKRYVLDRGGFTGPLVVELADRQMRHLQGVNGPTIIVPAEATSFDFPLSLPPWMELGRTCRAVLMATGEFDDGHGSHHKVCFTSAEANDQMVHLVAPAPLRMALDRGSVAARPRGSATVAVQIRRDASPRFAGPVRLELIVPAHVRDVAATPVEIPAGAERGQFTLSFGDHPGPFTAPLLIRATTIATPDPFVAESAVEIVVVE